MAPASLKTLSEQPFELLKELERRGRMAAAGRRRDAGAQEEWVGIGFVLSGRLMVSPREDVKEILTFPSLARVPGAKSWVRGLANIRGQLLPVIDLSSFFGGDETIPGRVSRVMVVNHPDIPAGLLVDEVRGFRRFPVEDKVDDRPDFGREYEFMLDGGFRREDETWYVLRLRELVESQLFLQAAE